MSKPREFHHDEACSLIEKVALLSAAVAVACVLGANFLSTMLQKGDLPIIAFAQFDRGAKRTAAFAPTPAKSREALNFQGVAVDMSATASIPRGPKPAPASPLSGKNKK